MGSYVARRLLQSVVVVIGVTLVSFLALQAGGDPTYLFVSERASLEEIEATRRALEGPREIEPPELEQMKGEGTPVPIAYGRETRVL